MWGKGKRTVIYDDGTPACLPAWARDELVRYRLENHNLRIELISAKARVHLDEEAQAMSRTHKVKVLVEATVSAENQSDAESKVRQAFSRGFPAEGWPAGSLRVVRVEGTRANVG